MAETNLNNKHVEYLETEDARNTSRVLFSGAQEFKKVDPNGETYLLKEPNEDDADYKVRLKRSTMDNYVEKIVQARQAFLFKDDHSRELPESMAQHVDDVNKKNVAADTFFASVAEAAQVDGIAWVVADMPKAPEDIEFASKKEEQDAGHRPFFEFIPGGSVLDWEVGDDGMLNWIVIAQVQPKPREKAGEARETVNQWKVWYRKKWELWEEKSGQSATSHPAPGSTSRYNLADHGENRTGVVPLVPFLGIRNTDYSGWPVSISVLTHIVLLLNKKSELDRIERLKTEPIPYAISPDKPVKIKATGGFWLSSAGVTSAQISVGFLEPAATGLDHNRASIEDLKATIVSIALAQAKKDSAQVQSAVGQREDRRVFTSSLKTASRSYERAETWCWQIWALWTGETGDIEINYTRDFADDAIDAAMLTVLNDLADSSRITDDTLLRLIQRAGIIPSTIEIEEELKKLEAKLKTEEAKIATNLLSLEPSRPIEAQSGDAAS